VVAQIEISKKKEIQPGHTDPKSVILTDEEQKAVDKLNAVRNFKKGTVLLREGEINSDSFYILTGCVRQYCLIDGEEKTINFYTEEQTVISTSTTSGRKPSKYFLECIEDTTLTTTTPEQLKEIYRRFPRFQELCRIITEEELLEYHDMFAKFLTSTPQERYLNLVKTRPDLLNRVPQYQLASYLGVKPESLSRIRKRVAKI